MNISTDKQSLRSSFLKDKDLFYRFFLGNVCLAKSCYSQCKYKMTSSAADIRIGDLWGRHYKENREGVSALVTFTTRGREVVHSLENCHMESLPLSVVTEGQMKKRLTRPWVYPIIMRDLAGHKSLSEIYKWIQLYLFTRLPYRILKRVRYLLHI